ncbi:MAG: hypothetical protein H7Y43_01020 [Akkermansiaceae bacterium]|nr:hypothetical protein [Verrucomicrobiales bacterium]
MVTSPARLVWLALTGFVFVSPLAAREYKLGEKADQTITTPIPLVVIDTAATEALKENESKRIPAIYRFYPTALEEVEAAFHSTFVRTRVNFTEAVQARFKRPTLAAEEVAATDFQRFLSQFQKQNVLFPVGPNLARLWAQGESDREVESALSAHLRETMKAYIRPDAAPRDIWVGSTIRLVSLANSETPDARLIEERGFNLAKTNFVSAPRCKTDLVNSFPAEERSIARYLASFIKPNCIMEADLTRELRAQRTEGLLAADRYSAGQVIVKAGQVVDQKILAALNQLREKTAVTQLIKLETPPGNFSGNKFNSFAAWTGGGILAAGLVCFALLWRSARHRAQASLMPVARPGFAMANVPTETAPADESWRERALLAEQRADKAQAVVRLGLMGHLAQWMAEKMTRKMISQRAQLLDDHQRAALEVAELEARLEKIQAPLQERLQAYERRIADLEKELTLKGEENRELIKAKIQIIRKQLEIEREKNRLEFN